MQTQKITVYTKSYCPYCSRAKAKLTEEGFTFEEHDIEHDEETFNDLKARTGLMTVPQIFVGETLIGGHDDMVAKWDEVKALATS